MNPNTATNEELRDWLARKQGWNLDCILDHPIPNSIDAAAKCLPEGWTWTCSSAQWMAWNENLGLLHVDRTPDEKTDRFRLAVKAIQAMEDGK